MAIASLLENIEFGDEKPIIKVLLNTPIVKEVRIVFRKGQVMKAHMAAHPIVVQVVEGSIDFEVAEKRYQLDQGMLIALDAHVIHELNANENSIVRLSVMKFNDVITSHKSHS